MSSPVRFAAVLLAAGASRRFGSAKLLAPVGGEPLVRRTARALAAAGADPLVAVLGARAPDVERALAGTPARVVLNGAWERGMLSSVRRGLAEVAACPLVAVTPADLPGLAAATVRRLATFAATLASNEVLVPSFGRRRGHPLFLPARLAARVAAWSDERRLSDLLDEPDVRVVHAGGVDDGLLRDADTPEDLAAARGAA